MGGLGIRDIGPDDSKFDNIEDPSSGGSVSPSKGIVPRGNSIKAHDENLKLKVDANGKAIPVDDTGDTIRTRKINMKKLLVYGIIGLVLYKVLVK